MAIKILSILFFSLLIFSCQMAKLKTNKETFKQGKDIYYSLYPSKPLRSYKDTTEYLLSKYYDSLDTCSQFYCTYYVLHSAFINRQPYRIKVAYSLVDDMQAKTDVYRGDYGFVGVQYFSKKDIYLDLKDWKKKLNCK